MSLVSIFGNLIVILCFLKYKSLRTHHNYYILSLSISDFVIGFFCIPFYAFNITFNNGNWSFGESLCRIWLILESIFSTASVLEILTISFDRFTSVVFPIKYRRWSLQRFAILNIFLVWLMAILFYVPAAILWPKITKDTHQNSSINAFKCRAEFRNNFYYLLVLSIFEFFLPLVLLIIFNISIYLSLRQRVDKTKSIYSSISQRVSIKTTGSVRVHRKENENSQAIGL